MQTKDFLWGVATSAYQAEGGYNGDGEPATNWLRAEETSDVAQTGRASDFWTRYEQDFQQCRELGLNAFRLGLEWSRIQPGREEGKVPPFDFAALAHYATILQTCRTQGLEPVVTLHHFVHPAWLGRDAWLDEKTPELFVEYVRTAVAFVNERLERPLHWFITINEPNMLVLNSYLGRQFPAGPHGGFRTMAKAYTQLLRAHVLAYDALHALYEERGWATPLVSLNNYCSDVYWSDKFLLDLLCARERGISRHRLAEYIADRSEEFALRFREARLPLHKDAAYYFGAAVKWMTNWLGRKTFKAEEFAPFLDQLYASPRSRVLDFIGLDYYDPFAAHVFRWPVLWDHEFKNKSLRSWVLSTVTSKWWDWRVLPRGLHFFCQCYARDYGRPLLIAENGMALRRRPDNTATHRRDLMKRSDFLRLHVHEVVKIVNEGIPLCGYLHWSLFDNYEWGSFTPRFGLYSINYAQGTERLVEDHTGDRPAETYARLVAEARERMGAVSPTAP